MNIYNDERVRTQPGLEMATDRIQIGCNARAPNPQPKFET
jgi:hypothetical protein